MNTNAVAIDAVFTGKQEQELLRQRVALLRAAQADEDDEGDVRRESRGGPREYEDDAQKLALLEVDGNRVTRSLDRMNLVNRALQKIREGTYGLSDVSGNPIPSDRLEGIPEAICTLDEEQRFELGAEHTLVTKAWLVTSQSHFVEAVQAARGDRDHAVQRVLICRLTGVGGHSAKLGYLYRRFALRTFSRGNGATLTNRLRRRRSVASSTPERCHQPVSRGAPVRK